MYKGEYFKGHPIIRNFWGVFFDFPFKMKKKFLGEFFISETEPSNRGRVMGLVFIPLQD